MSIKMFDTNHIKSPFTYQVNSGEKIKEKRLSTLQIITAIAVGILLSPLLIVGGYLSFLGITAAFKNKNIANWNKKHPPKPVKVQPKEVAPPASSLQPKKIENDVKPVAPLEKIAQAADSKLKHYNPLETPKIHFPPVAFTNIKTVQSALLTKINQNDPLLGKKIFTKEALELMDLMDDSLTLNETVLVLRSDGHYQYAKFKGYGAPGYPNNGKFDIGDGKIMNKPITDFHKIFDKNNPTPIVVGPTIELDGIVFSSESEEIEKMKTFLSGFSNYDPVFRALHFNNKIFSVIGSKAESFFNQPTALCGSNTSREVLTLDPTNSPRLKMHLDALIFQLSGKEGNENLMINTVSEYVKNMIFPNPFGLSFEPQVEAFIKSKGVQAPVIPIDEFILNRVASFRHHALVTAYILDGLTKCDSIRTGKPFLSGEVKVLGNDKHGKDHYEVVFSTQQHEIHLAQHSLPLFLPVLPK
jgi:hypothetical protein